MPRYRHRVHRVVVSLPDGHRVNLGSEWEELGVKPAPAPRRRNRKTDDTDD
jgi:hypothetical protein